METTKYTVKHTNRASRVQATVNPVPPDPNTVVANTSQAETVNRTHEADGRLKG